MPVLMIGEADITEEVYVRPNLPPDVTPDRQYFPLHIAITK